EVEFVEEEGGAAAAVPAGGRERAASAGVTGAAARTRPRKAAAARPAAVLEPVVPLGERLRQHRNALIFLTVGMLVVGTVAFRYQRAQRQELPRIAELGRVDGLA